MFTPTDSLSCQQFSHLRLNWAEQGTPVEAAVLIEGLLWADGALLLPALPADPFFPVLGPVLGVDAVAVRGVGLRPGAVHVGSVSAFCVGQRK